MWLLWIPNQVSDHLLKNEYTSDQSKQHLKVVIESNVMKIYDLSRMTHVPEVVRMEHASQGEGLPKKDIL